ncbi:farnesol dehydrogenase-like [Chrysoperla carnea]|uniref:farnesol dehydrogenase-like n=1 Tax=Chrysoperla carnea TaxID=189513 RepID=UPI001D0700BD|nr:farnesol dehydrogenase-like [Chrysoperla carnea]
MDSELEGKVVFLTGASAGIGAAIAELLVKNGLKVVGVARRINRLNQLKEKLSKASGQFYPIQCDLSKESEIISAIEWTKKNLNGIDILINNAGLSRDTNLLNGNTEDWRMILEVNVLGLCIATREAIRSMNDRKVSGHIIHVNSMGGHFCPITVGHLLSMYVASKHAVTALAETLRLELARTQQKIKVTSISPGLVKTEFLEKCGVLGSDLGIPMNDFLALEPEDVAKAILYVIKTPPNIEITELMIRSTGEVF